MSDDYIDIQQAIAAFMSGSSPIERYLQEQRPLTDLQLQSVSLTVSSLTNFLDGWKRKHGIEDSFLRFKSDLPPSY